MIYSRWRPDQNRFDYYEASANPGWGDDLPTQPIAAAGNIGAASVDIGRRIPAGARRVGAGTVARGMVVPVSGTAGLGALALSIGFGEIAMVVGGVVLGWWLRGRKG